MVSFITMVSWLPLLSKGVLAGSPEDAAQLRGTKVNPEEVEDSTGWGSCHEYGCNHGYVRGHGCQCNSQCGHYGNCCYDYAAKCLHPHPAPPHPTPHPAPAPEPVPGPAPGGIAQYDLSWKQLIIGAGCPAETMLTAKGGGMGGKITCEPTAAGRHFKFPVGQFDIDEQVYIPAGTTIEGHANPNDASDKAKKPDPATQTYFIATKGVHDPKIAYCGSGNNMKPGDAQKLRIGFLLSSNTAIRNINFQGRDTTRPWDNGSLCGGAVFETPGCVSPGFCDGRGHGFINKRNGCFDHAGRPNNLITGDGRGVTNVIIENVRLNDLFLPRDPHQFGGAQGSQIAVWLAQTKDGSATSGVHVRNLVSMLTRGDGINFHGNVHDSSVVDSHIENTGDDVYAIWGGYHYPTGIKFENNVAKNAGVTRNYGYGVCLAIYGAKSATVTGLKCYDRRHWNPGQVPHGDGACKNGAFCNSCLGYVHDNWFGAVYPDGNELHLYGNEYLYMDAPTEHIADGRPQIRTDHNSRVNIVSAPR